MKEKTYEEKSYNETVYNVLRLKLNKLNNKDTKDGVVFNVLEKDIKHLKIVIGDSELTRIITHLEKPNEPERKSDPPFIKELIIFKVGRCSKKYKDFKQHNGILTLNIIDDNGEVVKTKEYKRLDCGSSAVRNKKAFLVSLNLYDKVNEILLCGIPNDARFEHPSKFNAYHALPTSDSTPLETRHNIVVINDYEKTIFGKFDKVRYKDNVWSVTETTKHDITPFDGAGLIDIETAKIWASQLYGKDKSGKYVKGLSYTPASFQIRIIAGIKGNLYTFPIQEFARKFGKRKIIDAWGKEWDLIDDKIECILTKSQFKFFKKGLSDGYSSFEEWKENFDKEPYGYKYTFNISKFSIHPDRVQDNVVTAYQPLQTLHDLSNGEITALCNKTVERITKAHTDYKSFLMYRGLYDNSVDLGDKDGTDDYENTNNEHDFKIATFNPPFYEALKKNKDLINDDFVIGCIKSDLLRMKHKAYMGKLIVSGNFQTFTPDLVGLAQYAFGMKVTGLLQANTVYSQYWTNRNIRYKDTIPSTKELVIIRYPHISAEHCVVTLADEDNFNYSDMLNWYQYQNTGVLTSMYDSIAERLGNGDYDGDEILSTSNKVLLNAAKRNKTNTIIFTPEPKPDDGLSDDERLKRVPRINDIKRLIETDIKGMSNDIGMVVNKVTLLWQLIRSLKLKDKEVTKECLNNIKIMAIICGMTIDFPKTGLRVDIPKQIQKDLKGIKKPYFMRYKNDYTLSDDNNTDKDIKLAQLANDQTAKEEFLKAKKYLESECTMNRICWHMEDKIGDIKPQFGEKKDFDYQKLIKDPLRNKKNATFKNIKACLRLLHKDFENLSSSYRKEHTSNDYEYFGRYKQFYVSCRYTLLDAMYDGFYGEETAVNVLLDYLLLLYYEDSYFKGLSKYILWNAFEDEMIKRCGGDFESKDYDIVKLKEAKEKIGKKVKKQLENKAVKMGLPLHDEFVIYESELDFAKQHKQLKKLKDNYKAKRMLIVCIALCRMNKKINFTIKSRARKESDINCSRIQSIVRLSRPEYVYEVLRQLEQLRLIDIDYDKSSQIITITDEYLTYEGDEILIKNINTDLPPILKAHFRKR